MFSKTFIRTQDEYKRELEQRAQYYISEEEKEKIRNAELKLKETEELFQYIQKTRPELIARIDRIRTLVIHPFTERSTIFQPGNRNVDDNVYHSPDSTVKMMEKDILNSSDQSKGFIKQILKVDPSISMSDSQATRVRDRPSSQMFGASLLSNSEENITIYKQESLAVSNSEIEVNFSQNTVAIDKNDSTTQPGMSFRRESHFSNSPLKRLFGYEDKDEIISTKLICQYSFQFPPPEDSIQLRALGKEGQVQSMDELMEKWGEMLELQQLEVYYIWNHDALRKLILNHGMKIQRLFLKVHPLQETFFNFFSAEFDRPLLENLFILHLEIPKSIENLFCDQMQFLLKGISEFYFRIQKERISTPGFKTVNTKVFDTFMENCNILLRHFSVEGIDMTKMWIAQLLETFSSLQTISIGMCRRVIAREENDEVFEDVDEKRQQEDESKENDSFGSKISSSSTNVNSNTESTENSIETSNTNPNLNVIHVKGDSKALTEQDVREKRFSKLGLRVNTQQRLLQQASNEEMAHLYEPLIELKTKHTYITRCSFHQTDAVDDVTISTLTLNCPNIETLSISETYVTEHSLFYITRYLKKLDSLTFTGPKITKDLKIYPHAKLNHLHMNGHHCELEALVTLSFSFPVLQKLNLGPRMNIFEGQLIQDFLAVLKGEDARYKERFLDFFNERVDSTFASKILVSKDIHLEALKFSIIQTLVEMRTPDFTLPPQVAAHTALQSPTVPTNMTPSTPLSSQFSSPHHTYQSSFSNVNNVNPKGVGCPLRRKTLALPVVTRRRGFELFFDTTYEFLLQYAITDHNAKPTPIVKTTGKKKKKILKKRKKGTKKEKKKK